jgi:hypothetical protein
MGLISSLTYNASMGARNRETAEMQDATRTPVAASEIGVGDRLPLLQGEAWTVTEVARTGKRMSGLGLIRIGMARDELVRIVARSDRGETQTFEVPVTSLLLKAV